MSRTSGKWRARARSATASSRATSCPPGAGTSTSSPRRSTGSSATTPNSTTKGRARGRAGAATPTTTPNGSRPGRKKSKWSRRASPTRKATAPTGKSPVPYVPTVADRIEEAGLTWGIYAAQPGEQEGSKEERENAGPYKWAICPTFAECLVRSAEKQTCTKPNSCSPTRQTGTCRTSRSSTPTTVTGGTSQHNGTSMGLGDEYIARRGQGDPGRPGRRLDDDLHLLRRLRLLLRPRQAAARPRDQAPARDREPVREARLRRRPRRDQQLDPRLHGERAARRARGRTGRQRLQLQQGVQLQTETD